jgi:cadmium resistance protein CadD (predicted permease)
MNKNVIIGILGIVCIALGVFVFVQKSQIDEATTICEKEKELLEQIVKEQEVRATELQVMLDQERHQALVQRAIAEAQIEELKKQK